MTTTLSRPLEREAPPRPPVPTDDQLAALTAALDRCTRIRADLQAIRVEGW